MTTYSNSSQLRLTRRGRLTLSLMVTVTIFGSSLIGWSSFADATDQMGKPAAVTEWITVQSGDTLWQIASQLAPSKDPREVVWEIQQINKLQHGLQAGDRIRVPVY